MVCDPVVREIVGPDLLIDVAATDLILLSLLVFACFLLFEDRVETLMQDFEGLSLVLVLVSLVLGLSCHTCGDVSRTHSGVRLVHVLASRPTCAVGIDSDVLLVDVELLRDLWHDDDSSRARVHSSHLLCLRHPLHSIAQQFSAYLCTPDSCLRCL